jgi:hypothetical protein
MGGAKITLPEDPKLRYFAKGFNHPEWSYRTSEDLDSNFRLLMEKIDRLERITSTISASESINTTTQLSLGGRGGSGSAITGVISKFPFTVNAQVAEGQNVVVGCLVHVNQFKQAFLADSGDSETDPLPASGVCVSSSGKNIELTPIALNSGQMLTSDYDASGYDALYLGRFGRYTNKLSTLYRLQWVGKMLTPPVNGIVEAITLVSFGPFINGPAYDS